MIEFLVTEPNESDAHGSRVIDWPDIEAGKLILQAAEEVLTPLTSLTLHITYPLSNNVDVKIENPSGFTRRALVEAIYEAYRTIYDEEGEAPEKPEGSLLQNRPTTHGKYGIWGHDIDDLFLEGAMIKSDGMVELFIGS
jgi:hypothetical protein